MLKLWVKCIGLRAKLLKNGKSFTIVPATLRVGTNNEEVYLNDKPLFNLGTRGTSWLLGFKIQ
jgi:hypothetical protein